ncbi:polysaccharide lyase family 7 protein [Vibrio rarus]|uniref:polysaccharide lyase family 7 protein n=1 Tax=Vibrio rarus TaxID=413403 RepID=UPI0021C37CEC|nr:polysaccharide lyase family 7 protein [Vibrio rarus]
MMSIYVPLFWMQLSVYKGMPVFNKKFLTVAVSAILLAGCGGEGGSSSASATTATSTATSSTVTPSTMSKKSQPFNVTVIDGYLSNAEVWLDVNGNFIHDNGEPISMSGRSGLAVLDVTNIDNPSSFPIVAQANKQSTKDESTDNLVTVDYVLVAPPGENIVTPLSTLAYLKLLQSNAKDNALNANSDDFKEAKQNVAASVGIQSDDVMGDYIKRGDGDALYAASNIVASGVLPKTPAEAATLSQSSKSRHFTDNLIQVTAEIKAAIDYANSHENNQDIASMAPVYKAAGDNQQCDSGFTHVDGTTVCEVDSDKDGVANAIDAFPLDGTEWLDTDSDHIGDNADKDDDNDGLPDSVEKQNGTNPLLSDTDGDGVSDMHDAFPLDNSKTATVSQVAQTQSQSQPKPQPQGQQLLVIKAAEDDGSNDGHSPKNTIDGDTTANSRWSSEGVGKSITYDLGAQEQVQTVAIKWFKGGSRSSYFHIDTSIDKQHWTKVLTGAASSGDSSGYENFDVTDTNARYVRITGEGNSDSSTWNSIIETKIYGVAANGQSVPQQPQVDNSITASLLTKANTIKPVSEHPQTSQATQNVATGNAQYPSDLMGNYKQWKITYPTGKEQHNLYHVSNEYFHVNDEGNGIVFRVPIRSTNGTTKHTHNIRSELRELTASGGDNIYWTTKGTHIVYSRQKITHLPIVKSHLVATQIHGDKSSGIDDAMVLRLENQHLFLSFNGGKLRHDLTIENNYKLGTEQEVLFKVVNGKHYVYYSEDGKLKQAYENGNAEQYLIKDGGNDYVMDRNYDKAYFKIGNYTQSNPGAEGDYTDDPQDYGEVIVYDFMVSHES